MGMTPSADEVVVKVRIDGTAAMNDLEKVQGEATNKLSSLASGVAKTLTASLSYLYGDVSNQAMRAVGSYGSILGRAINPSVYGTAQEYWGSMNARKTAMDRTVEAFGMAGGQASSEQIVSVYNMYKKIEEQRSQARARVEGVVEGERASSELSKAASDIKFAATHFGEVMKQLLNVLGY